MSRLTRLLFLSTAVGLALFCLPALRAMAQESTGNEPARTRSYTLRSGNDLHGTILDSDESRVQLKLKIVGGSSVRWYKLSDFQPQSQVRLKHEMVADGDVTAQLAVAEFAADQGLIDQARIELKRCAYMAKESNAPQPDSFKNRAVTLTVNILKNLCERGDVAAARAGLTRLLTKHGDDLTSDQRSLLVHTVEGAAEQQQAAKDAKRRAKEDAKVTAEREKKLAPIRKHIDQAKAMRRSGLLNSRRYGAASRELTKAIKHLEDAQKAIGKLHKAYPDDPVMGAELNAASEEAKNLWQDTLLSRASLALAGGRFNDAMEGVNTVLADSPGQKEALAMRGRIETAQNDWGW